MTAHAEAVESKNQLIEVWTRLVEDRGGRVSTQDDVCRLWADSTFGFWNTVTLTGERITAGELGDQLARAAAFMRAQAQPGFLWLFEDLIDPPARDGLAGRLAAAGLEVAFTGHGMAGDLTVPEPRHAELEFRRVRTEQELLDYGTVNARAYGMGDDAARDALTGSKLWAGEAYAYLGYRDGVPVTAAATVAGPGADRKSVV